MFCDISYGINPFHTISLFLHWKRQKTRDLKWVKVLPVGVAWCCISLAAGAVEDAEFIFLKNIHKIMFVVWALNWVKTRVSFYV